MLALPRCKKAYRRSNGRISSYPASPLQDWLGREVILLEIRAHCGEHYTGTKPPDPAEGQGGGSGQYTQVTNQVIRPSLKRGLP